MVNQKLLANYPKEPTQDEIDRNKEDQMRDEIAKAFQKMYGSQPEEDSSEVK